MRIRVVHTKIIAVALCVLTANFCFGSISGTTIDEHSNKFSLRNLSTLSKNYSLSYLRMGTYRFMGTQQVSQQKVNNTVEVQSMMRVQRGNTTFVYPYKYKVQTPKFKAPAPPPLH